MTVLRFALFISAIATTLGGCVSSTAPLWPTGGVPKLPPSYSQATCEETASEKKDSASTKQEPAPTKQEAVSTSLTCARKQVNEQFDSYAGARHNIENYRNGANLSLFGIGGAAGVNAVTKGSKEGLQTLGLVAAGLVGLDGVLKVDEQHTTFGAGLDALRCVANLDLSKDGARQSLFGSKKSQLTFTTRADFAPLSLDASGRAFEGLKSQHFDKFSAAVKSPSPNAETLALVSEAYQQRITALGELKQQLIDWYPFLYTIASETDEQRANNLHFALNDIRKAVSDRLLYSNKDISAIYDALKGAMAKAVPKPPPATPGPGGTGPKAANAIVLAAESAEITRIRTLLEQAQKSTEDYKETYKACLALAAAKGSGGGQQ